MAGFQGYGSDQCQANGSHVDMARAASSAKRSSSMVVSHSIPCTPPTSSAPAAAFAKTKRIKPAAKYGFANREGMYKRVFIAQSAHCLPDMLKAGRLFVKSVKHIVSPLSPVYVPKRLYYGSSAQKKGI